jgi:hypothetical protein
MQRKDFKGAQSDRNYLICHKYLQGETSEAIAQYLIDNRIWEGKLDSVASLCRKIIYKNRAVLKIDAEYEKVKDLLRIEREIESRGLGKKDKVDLIKVKHEILQGNKPIIDNSKHVTNHFNVEGKSATELIGAINNRMAQRVTK